LKSVHKTFAEKQKNKSKLSKVLMVGAAATGLTCFLVSLAKKTKGGIKLDPTARPIDRADNWFKWFDGTEKDVTDFLGPTESLSIIRNPKYKEQCEIIEADLKRMKSFEKYLQQINGSEEVMREIMYKAARNADYYQEHSRLIVILMHVFAEPDEENGNYKITNERKAKAFFVYNKFTKILDMIFKRSADSKDLERKFDNMHFRVFTLNQIHSLLVDSWSVEYAILFWEIAILKASTCSQKIECIYNSLFTASKLFSDKIFSLYKNWLIDGPNYNDIKNNFACITPENNKMYESILNKTFGSVS
jgi:hypothetical protein